MNSNSENRICRGNLAGLTPSECLCLLAENRRKWLLPTFVCGTLALAYSLVMTRYWEATQGLVVRREVSSSAGSEPGKFADLYEMRTFQETILELAKTPQVISATLKAVEQVETDQSAEYPSPRQIETFRERLSLLPPGGAEFGKTEVCYLQVKDTNPERAKRLVAELGEQIDARLRTLRKEQSKSLSEELNQQVALAQADLARETKRLADFEAEVGTDLGELRMLNASFSGQSDLRQQAVAINDERRSTEMQVREAEQLLAVLHDARQSPEQLIAVPSSLLASQPTLRRLKEGLVDAQLRAARLGGTRTSDHPQVRASRVSVQAIRNDLHGELEVAIRGVSIELQLAKNRLAKQEHQHQNVQQRLRRLAELRADYANRTSAVENSRLVLDQAQQQLGEVNASQVAANGANLVTPIDQPDTGSGPAGLGRATVVLCGTFGGFVFGIGWLFLTVLPPPATGEDQPISTFADRESAAPPAAANEPVAPGASLVRGIPSSLPPTVADKLAEIVAARDADRAAETRF